MKRIILLAFAALLINTSACRKKEVKPDPVITNPGETINESGLITFSPAFPTDDKPLTITFDPAKGNEGLKGFSGDMYLHTGVITDKSTGTSDWKYVKNGSFTTAVPELKMTYSNGKYSITLTPRQFYGVPAGEKIVKIALLFRNADGTKVARNKDGSDIYLPIFESGKLSVRFTSPEMEPMFTPTPAIKMQLIGDELSVSGLASKSANLTLSLNGTSFATANNAVVISGKVNVSVAGVQQVKLTANDGSTIAEATFDFLVSSTPQIADLPAGAKEGVTFINNGTSAIVNLFAPEKQSIYVIGDFNDWKPDVNYQMKRTSDAKRWWIQIDQLDPTKEYAYQFLVDGSLRIADPYAEKILDPQHDSSIPASVYPGLKSYPIGKTTGIVSVMQGNQPAYSWQTASFTRPERKDLVIYELHLRDFIANHDYNTLVDSLNYLSRLGVNAIELMPVTEFEGNSSWGYNVSHYFAPDKYYGTKNALKRLIDECHQRGIAVIMDMVLNHAFGQSPMVQLYFQNGKPAANSPWFNTDPTHPYNVGYDFNHEKSETKYFVKNVLEHWMKEYKVDGFRFDLSKGFTQKNSGTSDAAVGTWSAYDASRVQIWKEYNNFIKSIDPNFYVILEHFAADAEEQELANAGMLFWNNLNYNYNEASMAWITGSDLSRTFYTTHSFSQPYNLVSYMESHDEERMMFKNLQYGNSSATYNIKNLTTALKRQEIAAAFFFSTPGPKMLWQFGELGYDVSIDQNGRTGEKPIRWSYNSDPQRKALYTVYSKLIKLKRNNPIFATTNFQYSLTSAVKYIKLMSLDENVVVVGNFDVVPQDAIVNFPVGGTWYDQFTKTSVSLPGGAYTATLAPGEYHIYTTKLLQE